MTGPAKCVNCGQQAGKVRLRDGRPVCRRCKRGHHPWAKTKAIVKAERLRGVLERGN